MSILATIFGVYLLLLGFMYFFQNSLLFMPSSQMVQTPKSVGMEAEDFWAETDDGIRVHGWYFPNNDSDYVIVLSHGNAGNISYRIDIARTLLDTGAAVLMYDYRGYGQSEGRPSEKGLYKDIEGVVETLMLSKGYGEHQIVMYGRSLGGAVAAYAATKFHLGGLVLDSAFKNLRAMVSDVYPFVPSRLAKYTFPTGEFILHDRDYPIMIFHSPNDEIVGYHHGEYLYNLLDEPKRFVDLTGGHNNNFFVSRDLITENWNWYLGEISGKNDNSALNEDS